MASPSSPIVQLRGLSVRAGVTTILRDVDFDLHPGEVVGMFGANGAGKTTLLRTVATLIRPAAGTGTVLGADMSGSDRLAVRSRIGLIGHIPALYPELTLRENLSFAGALIGTTDDDIDAALDTVGLGGVADRMVTACSHGMQRRTEFARELLRDPTLLLLDEPHSALDPSAVELVASIVGRVAESGGAAILASHDRERVEKLAGRTVELSGGSLG